MARACLIPVPIAPLSRCRIGVMIVRMTAQERKHVAQFNFRSGGARWA
jgi:hypothetical protein